MSSLYVRPPVRSMCFDDLSKAVEAVRAAQTLELGVRLETVWATDIGGDAWFVVEVFDEIGVEAWNSPAEDEPGVLAS